MKDPLKEFEDSQKLTVEEQKEIADRIARGELGGEVIKNGMCVRFTLVVTKYKHAECYD